MALCVCVCGCLYKGREDLFTIPVEVSDMCQLGRKGGSNGYGEEVFREGEGREWAGSGRSEGGEGRGGGKGEEGENEVSEVLIHTNFGKVTFFVVV